MKKPSKKNSRSRVIILPDDPEVVVRMVERIENLEFRFAELQSSVVSLNDDTVWQETVANLKSQFHQLHNSVLASNNGELRRRIDALEKSTGGFWKDRDENLLQVRDMTDEHLEASRAFLRDGKKAPSENLECEHRRRQRGRDIDAQRKKTLAEQEALLDYTARFDRPANPGDYVKRTENETAVKAAGLEGLLATEIDDLRTRNDRQKDIIERLERAATINSREIKRLITENRHLSNNFELTVQKYDKESQQQKPLMLTRDEAQLIVDILNAVPVHSMTEYNLTSQKTALWAKLYAAVGSSISRRPIDNQSHTLHLEPVK